MNGVVMKSFFQRNVRMPLFAALLIITATCVVCAQDPRIQLASLDHLAAKASQTVDVSIDERLMKIAAMMLSDDGDEKAVKKLVTGLKGIYVKNFEFEADGQYTAADLESIRTQLRAPAWTRMVNVNSRKEGAFEVYLMLTGEKISGLALLHSDAKELTVVNIVGPINLERLTQLEGQLGIPDFGIEPPKPKTKNEEK
jgi:hypothetical protein